MVLVGRSAQRPDDRVISSDVPRGSIARSQSSLGLLNVIGADVPRPSMFTGMDSATILLFWLGVAMQLAGFGLQWRKVQQVAKELRATPQRMISGRIFAPPPRFFVGEVAGEGSTVEQRLEDLKRSLARVDERVTGLEDALRNGIGAEREVTGHAIEGEISNVRSFVTRLQGDGGSDEVALVLFITGLAISSAAAQI